jgi:hypothetical protein
MGRIEKIEQEIQALVVVGGRCRGAGNAAVAGGVVDENGGTPRGRARSGQEADVQVRADRDDVVTGVVSLVGLALRFVTVGDGEEVVGAGRPDIGGGSSRWWSRRPQHRSRPYPGNWRKARWHDRARHLHGGLRG